MSECYNCVKLIEQFHSTDHTPGGRATYSMKDAPKDAMLQGPELSTVAYLFFNVASSL